MCGQKFENQGNKTTTPRFYAVKPVRSTETNSADIMTASQGLGRTWPVLNSASSQGVDKEWM